MGGCFGLREPPRLEIADDDADCVAGASGAPPIFPPAVVCSPGLPPGVELGGVFGEATDDSPPRFVAGGEIEVGLEKRDFNCSSARVQCSSSRPTGHPSFNQI